MAKAKATKKPLVQESSNQKSLQKKLSTKATPSKAKSVAAKAPEVRKRPNTRAHHTRSTTPRSQIVPTVQSPIHQLISASDTAPALQSSAIEDADGESAVGSISEFQASNSPHPALP